MPDPIDVALGARIRAHRKYIALSQEKLAAALGVTFQQVQKYERGENRVSASTLVRIAAALDTVPSALLGETEDSSTQQAWLFSEDEVAVLRALRRIGSVRVKQQLLRLIDEMAAPSQDGLDTSEAGRD